MDEALLVEAGSLMIAGGVEENRACSLTFLSSLFFVEVSSLLVAVRCLSLYLWPLRAASPIVGVEGQIVHLT